jgi:signal transduction histidine kinase
MSVSVQRDSHIGASARVPPAEQPLDEPSFRPIRHRSGFRTIEPVTSARRSLWAEPSATDPAPRVWRDWLLFVVLFSAVALEGILHTELVWRAGVIPVAMALTLTVFWRRTHPLAMVALVFGAVTVLDIASFIAEAGPVELYSGAYGLLLVYSLFRWASGRDAAIGLAITLVTFSVSLATDFPPVGDIIGGIIVLMFPAVLGLGIRYQGIARNQQMEQFRLQERQQLARELHDTVAHHVSAIAIQAQAGRFLAKSNSLDGAAKALEVIEEEASRTLAEMRSIVGVLRDNESGPEMAPQPRIVDLEQLATALETDGLHVGVELSGDLDNLQPPVETAVYRLAQESVTNAVRHARHATRVDVQVDGDAEAVRLTVNDDGVALSGSTPPSGYGLIGMTERATLLGGTLEAGPGHNRGWTVHAVLPRQRRAT